MTDATMTAITAAVTVGRQGNPGQARADLATLWNSVGVDGDPLHRVTIAHYIADLYDHAADALIWDVRALDAAQALTDERAKQEHESLDVRGFYPSLHLNLADNLRRLGAFDSAHQQLDAARERLAALGEGAFDGGVRAGITHVETALAEGNTDRLPTH
ncbi:hypothetical protein GFY24_08795 [Nocardia sp. SYP-A9097]|uniref:hypothetical protein n=1 Tax=Nocardia sp. SYP-A9097 TaxID=2663237 RepID=UPI00129A7307|nr:hypothetical protein [Nocardia sp. SYP-A9097]MRH87552.1 hypothetical protein [Nocardia sp. SYP-A9097]